MLYVPPLAVAEPPPIVVTWPGWAVWLVAVGAVAGAVYAIGRTLGWAGSLMRGAGQWFAEIVRREVTEIVDARIAPLQAELTENGGSSIKDRVGRIDRSLAEHVAASADAREHADADRAELRGWLEELEARLLPPDDRSAT